MKILVTVKAGAKEEKIKKSSIDQLTVWVRAPAKEGKANDAVEKLLAEHFDVAPSAVQIISGRTSRKKIIEISG